MNSTDIHASPLNLPESQTPPTGEQQIAAIQKALEEVIALTGVVHEMASGIHGRIRTLLPLGATIAPEDMAETIRKLKLQVIDFVANQVISIGYELCEMDEAEVEKRHSPRALELHQRISEIDRSMAVIPEWKKGGLKQERDASGALIL